MTFPTVSQLLLGWIDSHVTETGRAWIRQALTLAASGDRSEIMILFALVARRLGKDYLEPSLIDLEMAHELHPGWNPSNWTVEQAARGLILLHGPADNAQQYHDLVETLFSDGDAREQVAILKALPLLPHAECFVSLACEGARSNMSAMLEAIAFDNPYPIEHFNEMQWNAMVLKCLFLDLGVSRIAGLEARMNDELKRMTRDLVNERKSAGRPLPKEVELIPINIQREETQHVQA